MNDYETLLKKAEDLHGEICPGMLMGTRMSIAAMEKMGMDPMKPNENLMVFVETDRCMPDAIQAITGCSLGKRTLRFKDHGKFVATFKNLETGKIIRISARDDKLKDIPGLWAWFSKIVELTNEKNFKKVMETKKSGIEKFLQMSDEDLLFIEEIELETDDIPGLPKNLVTCSICGEHVLDKKEIVIDKKPVCLSCAANNLSFD